MQPAGEIRVLVVLALVILYLAPPFIILRHMTDTKTMGAFTDQLPATFTHPGFLAAVQSPKNRVEGCLDLFIPYHVSDHEVFILQGGLDSIRKHVKGWRKLFIVSAENVSLNDALLDDTRISWRSEETFSFSRNKQQAKLGNWYLQQALKLLAPLEMPDMCHTFLVLDADLHFVRDWSPSHAPGQWKYLFPRNHPGGHQAELGNAAHASTWAIAQIESLTTPGTLCTVHHHMVMQKDVLRGLHEHITGLHHACVLDVLTQAQLEGRWVSEFDIYLSFAWHTFHERVQLVEFPYLHAREKARCSQQDVRAFARDTDIVFMACHDHYVGHDMCSGSANNCSSAVAFCDRLSSGGNCKAHDYDVVPCHRPVLSEDRGMTI